LFTGTYYARRPDKAFLFELLRELNIDLRIHAFEGLSFYDSIELLVRRFSLVSQNPVYIRFFLDEVLKFTQKNSSGASGFLEYWMDNCSKLSVSITEQIDAVQILTVHKSKGLDFPVVIYAFPDQRRDIGDYTWDNISVLLDDKDTDNEKLEMPLVYKYCKDLENTPLGDDYLIEQARICLDKFNLYYVAFTRASERLYVIVEETKNVNDPPKKLSDLVASYISKNNNENTFGTGEVVKGKYSVIETGDDAMPDLAYNAGDWVNRITLAKREYSDKTSFGTLVHEVLSEINTFEDRERAIDHIFSIMNVNSPELRLRVLATLESLISLPDVMPFFSGGRVIREQEIMTPDGECYRPDRIVLNDDQTYVIDFKTGLPNTKHSAQVLLYMSLIRKMDYPEPAGYIIYLGEQPQLVKVDSPAQASLALY
jgi:ATP-dependent exoDNAse (exonuclease V) beta subunit